MVSFDVDGTIFRKAALTEAARPLGIAEKWDALEEMHLHRRITKGQLLTSQYQLLEGKRLADILREVSRVQVIKNIRETVQKLQGHGVRVVLLTDNPDFLCAYLIERFGFEGYVGSKVGIKDGIVTGEIEPLPDKRLGLRKYCAWTGIPPLDALT
jgi:HAD superfamily phosphoserine phosphatase-like hydrolase